MFSTSEYTYLALEVTLQHHIRYIGRFSISQINDNLGRVNHRLGTSLKLDETTNCSSFQIAITYSNFVQIGNIRCFLTSQCL